MSFSIKKSHKFLTPPAPPQSAGKKRRDITSSGMTSTSTSTSSMRKPKNTPSAKPDGTQGLCIRESARAQEDFY